MAQSPDEDSASWSAAIHRYQETAKWAIGVLGALGGVLIASLSIAGLGAVHGADQIWAIAGFALALLGVMVATGGVIAVLAPTRPDFFQALEDEEMKSRLNSTSAFLLGFHDTTELKNAYVHSGRERIKAYKLMVEAEARGDFVEKQTAQAQADRSERIVELVRPSVEFVKLYAFRTAVRRNFRRWTVTGLLIGVVFAAIGVTIFSVFSAGSTDSKPAASKLVIGRHPGVAWTSTMTE